MKYLFVILMLLIGTVNAHEEQASDLVALEDLVQTELVKLDERIKALEMWSDQSTDNQHHNVDVLNLIRKKFHIHLRDLHGLSLPSD